VPLAVDTSVLISRPDPKMVTPGPALELAAAAKARVLELSTDCGHLVPGCESDRIAAAVAAFLQ
jgi:homoserine O-acetyltransferase/O-succinyltransferase